MSIRVRFLCHRVRLLIGSRLARPGAGCVRDCFCSIIFDYMAMAFKWYFYARQYSIKVSLCGSQTPYSDGLVIGT